MPHYDVREDVEVYDNEGTRHDNNTLHIKPSKFGHNLVRNDTDTRLINLIVNGADENKNISDVTLFGIRCITDCGIAPVEDLPLEERIRYWSVAEDWGEGGAVPKDGEEVVIPTNWNMMYDVAVADTVKLISLQVNGKLSFMPGEDRLLKTYNLWVRAGELNIGSADEPFPDKATIELQGDHTEHYFAFNRHIEVGNKNLVVTGTVNMHGKARTGRTRLIQSVYRGQRDFVVEQRLDWQVGEQLVFAPTNMRTIDTDICTIASYNPQTGEGSCEEKFEGFHFGDDSSTEEDHGVD